ncbi:hypothetical protein SAMN05421505_102237 [Sinosporangium album]|uniref:Uncharacterized protein n=1 Tax=Sinosporangium album TaxID=504805 RepID=A0A1G7SDE8_9ACTN|nr:hypothetical protein SAMN05421505_102237 [Sinosporangium album]
MFGLNRSTLVRGRALAFVRTVSVLRDWRRLVESGDAAQAGEVALALAEQPFTDVLSAMRRYRDLPNASVIMRGAEVVEALADPRLGSGSRTRVTGRR